MIPRLLRYGSLALLAGHVLVHGIACSDDQGHGPHGSAGTTSVSVDVDEYEGKVTDEAAESMLGVIATVDDAKAPALTAPTDGQTLPGATPFTFTWAAYTAQRTRLPGWLGPERSAHAHGDPFTGVGYVLMFTRHDGSDVLRVMTDKTSYTPGEASWAKLKAVGDSLHLKVVAARLENNLVVAGGGPYTTAGAAMFTIAP